MTQLLFDRVRYYLKKPGKGRASFSILKDVVKNTGERLSEKVKDPRIDAINHLYKQKLRDFTTCEIEMRAIIRGLNEEEEKKRGKKVWNEENRQLLEAYWAAEYATKPNRDLKAARNRLMRALEAVGQHSLISAKREVLEAAINKHAGPNSNKQRSVASAINQLLRFAKRGERIRLARSARPDIHYLTLDEFEEVLGHVADETHRLIFKVCFATGGRLGEVFALARASLPPHGKSIHIREQMLRSGLLGELKNNTPRHAYILPEYRDDVRAWVKVGLEKRAEYREERLADVLKDACRKVFGEDEEKLVTVHDLRHSYAVHLCQSGVNITLVAQALGDSVAVAEMHYGGFILRPEGIETISSIME